MERGQDTHQAVTVQPALLSPSLAGLVGWDDIETSDLLVGRDLSDQSRAGRQRGSGQVSPGGKERRKARIARLALSLYRDQP